MRSPESRKPAHAALSPQPGVHSSLADGNILLWPVNPNTLEITDYDYRHAQFYLSLLTAEAHAEDTQQIVRWLMEQVPSTSPKLARAIVSSHLQRARWLLDRRFFPLLWALDD